MAVMKAGGGSSAKPRAPTSNVVGRPAVGQAQIVDRSGRISEYSSSDDKCPICKTDRYLSPRLRLMVSPCYHKMCESCIDRLFSLGPAACPVCGQIIRKQQFSAQTFQDLRVEEEVNVRKRVAKLFNRTADDFPSLRAYNDYLEEFEEITFNLVHKIDLERTQSRLAQYEALNRSLIAAQQQQRDLESDKQLQLDEAARRERILRAEKVQAEQELERAQREEDEREMVAALAQGRSVEDVMEARQRRAEERRREAQRREEAERRRQEQEEQRAASAQRFAERAQVSGAEAELARGNCTSLDYRGPLATIDDGSALADARTGTPPAGPPAGYTDPWLRPELVSKSACAQYRAGGYDWTGQVWRRALNAACDGLSLYPAGSS